MPARKLELQQWLRNHLPLDPVEATHRDRMLALLASAADPFARDHFEPGHFTASAFVLSPEADRVLLIHHRHLRRWLQPGGHVEPDDVGIFTAALREVREETGLQEVASLSGAPCPAPFDLDVHVIPERGKQPRHLHYDVRFLLRSTTARLVAASDARVARWVSPDEWPGLGAGASLERVAEKLRSTIDHGTKTYGETK